MNIPHSVNDAIVTRNVGLAGIAVLPDRLRQVREDVVTSLAESMKERGLLHPIILRSASTGYYLVAGWHRYEAARRLKWEAIPARILPDGVTDDEARLAEIDENLQSAGLSPRAAGEKVSAKAARRHADRERLQAALEHMQALPDEDDDDEYDPALAIEQTKLAFLLGAHEALQAAEYYGPADSEIIETARDTAAAWGRLVSKLTKEES